MGEYVIIVDFQLKQDRVSEFHHQVTRNARLSLQDEPGCERFDVLVPPAEQARVILYEIYADRSAFDAHCRTPHFFEFDAAVGPMVRSKTVTELGVLHPSSHDRPETMR